MKNSLLRILGWLLFLLSGLLLGWILFLGRETAMTMTMLISRNAYVPRFIDKAYLVIAGIFWLVAWIYLEAYFSRAAKKRRLWPSVLYIAGVELILLFLLTILPMFFTDTGVNWPAVALDILALIAGTGLLLFSRRLLTQNVSARVS